MVFIQTYSLCLYLNIQAMDDSGVQATIQEHILFVLIYDVVVC